jgi:hypothetical protein
LFDNDIPWIRVLELGNHESVHTEIKICALVIVPFKGLSVNSGRNCFIKSTPDRVDKELETCGPLDGALGFTR